MVSAAFKNVAQPTATTFALSSVFILLLLYDFNVQTLEIENMLNLFQIIKKKILTLFFFKCKICKYLL